MTKSKQKQSNQLIKILFLVASILFAIPSILYWVKKGTVLNFGPYFYFLYDIIFTILNKKCGWFSQIIMIRIELFNTNNLFLIWLFQQLRNESFLLFMLLWKYKNKRKHGPTEHSSESFISRNEKFQTWKILLSNSRQFNWNSKQKRA